MHGTWIARLLGRHSSGFRGPCSGQFWAYAYRNAPDGRGCVGRCLDRALLRSATCAELRARAESVKRVLREIVAERRRCGQTTTILDVAAGQAPYLRELFRELGEQSDRVYCSDRDPREVVEGRKAAAQDGLRNFQFNIGDAGDAASYLVPLHPHAVVALGLLETLPGDPQVRRVIALAYQALAPAGYFLLDARAEHPAGCQQWECWLLGLAPVVRPIGRISAWLRQVGFEEVRVEASGTDCVLFVARKGNGSPFPAADSDRGELR